MSPERIGLIAGNGSLPRLFADAARSRGLEVIAVAHRGETDPELASHVAALTWVRVGQLGHIAKTLKRAGVAQAVMAGGIGKVRALTEARPDWGALAVLASLATLRDDALLRAIARYFEKRGIRIVAPTDYLTEALAPAGLLAGKALSVAQHKDVALGAEVARALGRVDVGQTVVVKGGNVLAVEAAEGTDETIRRGAQLGGEGAVVVKVCKPGQDDRFDLPSVGPHTITVMAQSKARVLAVEAGRTLLLETDALLKAAAKAEISVFGL